MTDTVEVQPTDSVTFRFGPGYDHATHTVRGSSAELQQKIQEGTGISAAGKTLFEQIVEAQSHANGLVNAATIGATPGRNRSGGDVLDEASAAARRTPEDVRQSIAEKAAAQPAAAPETAQPEDASGDTFALIDNAMSREAMLDIAKAHKAAGNTWTAEHKARAQARIAELEK